MIFQWYLFVLLIVMYWFTNSTNQTHIIRINGRKEKRYNWLPVIIMIIPMIITAALRDNSFGDTGIYKSDFENLSPYLDAIPRLLAADGKDKGFGVFGILIKILVGNNYKIYFAIIAAICLFCVAYIYHKYSCNFAMSMFLFLASSDYLSWTHNGVRQFVAVCIIFASTDLLLKKKYVWYVIVILLASTIHATALLMIPICFIVQGKAWNLRSIGFTVLVLIVINFSGALTDLIVDFMTDTHYKSEVDQFLQTTGTNILRVLVFMIPPILAFIFRRYVYAAKYPILDLSVNMSIISMGAYIISAVTSGIFIGRIPIYFSLYNYILLPWLIENVFEKRSRRLVYAAVILCYMCFYYYQVGYTWGF